MPSNSPLSAMALRAGDSPISDLMARALSNPDLISLAAGFVDQATLPVEATEAAVRAVLGDDIEGRRALQYGTTRGDLALRTRLIRRLERQEHVPEGTYQHAIERTLITSGSQQLLYLTAEVLVDPGDIVLVESPSYFVFLGVLKSRGARTVGVEVDEGGLRIDALEARLAEIEARGELNRVKLIYTVSEHSNPSGLTLDADRRAALVKVAHSWSKHHRIYVLEDAAYRGLTYEGDECASVWAHDPDGETVIHARTFSKTFSPGLKTGYGIIPASLMHVMSTLKGNHDFGSSHFNQRVLEHVIDDGSYDHQIERLRTAYDAKRRAMLAALDEHFGPLGDAVHWTRPRGGLYVWLTLPSHVDTHIDSPFFHRCMENGVIYVPGSYAFADEPAPPPTCCARLSYGVSTCMGIGEGIRRLARSFAECDPGARRSPRSVRETLTAQAPA